MPILDSTISGLFIGIALLILTGGLHYSSPSLKLELSEVDVFAWVLLALMALRKRRFGSWAPEGIERVAGRALRAIGSRPQATLAIATAAYVVLHAWILIWRFDSFHANAYDMGYVDQSLWSTTRIGFLHSSLSRGGTYFGEHFSPILGAIALIYRGWDSPYAVFLFQTLVIASGSILVYLLALQKRVSRPIAVLLALCYFVYQPVRSVNGFDFREDDLFIPIFLGALLMGEKKSWPAFWALALLSWTVKENAMIFTAMIGTWLLLRRKDPRRAQGALLFALSAVAFLLINLKVTPHFAGPVSETMAVRRLGKFGHSNSEILSFIGHHPLAFLQGILGPVFQRNAIRYFLNVSTPFLVFAGSAPLIAAIAGAGILMNIIVNNPTLGFHYECVLIPFLFYVLVSGVASSRAKAQPVLLLVSFLLFFGRGPVYSLRMLQPNDHHRMVAAELAKIPPDASITTQTALFPHLDHREDARLYGASPTTTDYAIYDFSPGLDRYGTPSLEGDLSHLDKRLYKKIFDQDRFQVYRRVLAVSSK